MNKNEDSSSYETTTTTTVTQKKPFNETFSSTERKENHGFSKDNISDSIKAIIKEIDQLKTKFNHYHSYPMENHSEDGKRKENSFNQELKNMNNNRNTNIYRPKPKQMNEEAILTNNFIPSKDNIPNSNSFSSNFKRLHKKLDDIDLYKYDPNFDINESKGTTAAAKKDSQNDYSEKGKKYLSYEGKDDNIKESGRREKSKQYFNDIRNFIDESYQLYQNPKNSKINRINNDNNNNNNYRIGTSNNIINQNESSHTLDFESSSSINRINELINRYEMLNEGRINLDYEFHQQPKKKSPKKYNNNNINNNKGYSSLSSQDDSIYLSDSSSQDEFKNGNIEDMIMKNKKLLHKIKDMKKKIYLKERNIRLSKEFNFLKDKLEASSKEIVNDHDPKTNDNNKDIRNVHSDKSPLEANNNYKIPNNNFVGYLNPAQSQSLNDDENISSDFLYPTEVQESNHENNQIRRTISSMKDVEEFDFKQLGDNINDIKKCKYTDNKNNTIDEENNKLSKKKNTSKKKSNSNNNNNNNKFIKCNNNKIRKNIKGKKQYSLKKKNNNNNTSTNKLLKINRNSGISCMKNIPFMPSSNNPSCKSYSIFANVQQVFSMMKRHDVRRCTLCKKKTFDNNMEVKRILQPELFNEKNKMTCEPLSSKNSCLCNDSLKKLLEFYNDEYEQNIT
ncbi:hypothetical protein U3516DRAFT_616176 [Neocallimastix sp. 'constans']